MRFQNEMKKKQGWLLYTVGGFYDASHFVEREEFRKFSQNFLRRHGIQALSWNLWLPASERDAYEKSVQQEGYTHFEVRERDGDGRLVRAGQLRKLNQELESRVRELEILNQSMITREGRILELKEKLRQLGGPL